ncbi:MAG: 16S rRNA (adenine(1518)-N(6)/adenine(1519)-N(6))-dimethyltransferase RsmA [Gemmatimonadota bacterium]|nr:16S rRNA (adenine(1518)-N(6)/adenine(1519)-N(6))-dimethyltransferase RsmA [Gemmatimonadota bacterium]
MSGHRKKSVAGRARKAGYRRKLLGQHFLHHGPVAGRIVDALGDLGQAHVLEIGPGRGVLSFHLADRAARFTAVEMDGSLADALVRRFDGRDSVEILQQDILEFDLGAWAVACAPLHPVVAGNIPYRITNGLLYKLIGCSSRLGLVLLMLQEEVANKLTARAGGKPYGMLTVRAGLRADMEYLFSVGRENFHPPPSVDSAVVRFDFNARRFPLSLEEEKFFDSVVRRLFQDRRKQIQKILRTDPRFKLAPEALKAVAAQTGLDLSCRPEQLEVKQFITLAGELKKIV